MSKDQIIDPGPQPPEAGEVAAEESAAQDSSDQAMPHQDPAPNVPSPAPATSNAGRQILKISLPSLAVAGSIGLLGMARERFQHGHMFLPTRFPEGRWQPDELGFEDVEFESEDGTRLHGWWIENPRPEPHRGGPMTVLYCHGNSGNITDRAAIFASLLRLGVDVFAFDYRGFGRSDGSPTEDGVCADVRAAVDHLSSGLGVPNHRTLLFGHSLGGAIAIDGAFHRRDIAGLIVQSSFTQNLDMARHFYPDLPVHWITRNGFRSIEKVPELPMPKLFIHGKADEKIPFQQGEALFAAAAEAKTWLPVSRAGHNDVHLWGGLRYFSHLKRFGREARRHGLATAAASAALSSE